MKPIIALFGFMLSTLALFLQPTPNPEDNSSNTVIQETPRLLDTYDQPVEYFTDPLTKEIL